MTAQVVGSNGPRFKNYTDYKREMDKLTALLQEKRFAYDAIVHSGLANRSVVQLPSKTDSKKYQVETISGTVDNFPTFFNGQVTIKPDPDKLVFSGRIEYNQWIGEFESTIPDKGILIFSGKFNVTDIEQLIRGEFNSELVTLTYRTRFTYTGPLQNGKPHGFGTLRNEAGELVFEGLFDNNQYKLGTTYEPSCTYVGEFKNHAFDGIGKAEFEDGTIQEGIFENDEFKAGQIRYKSGKVFKGTIVDNNVKNGTTYFSDGGKYKGQVVNGKFEGNGKQILPDGTIKEGVFKNSRLIEGRVVFKDRTEEGKFQDNKLCKGVIRFSKGPIFTVDEYVPGQGHKGEIWDAENKLIFEGFLCPDMELNGTYYSPQSFIFAGSLRIIPVEGTLNFVYDAGILTIPGSRTLSGKFNDGEFVSGTIEVVDGKIETGRFKEHYLIKGVRTYNGIVEDGVFEEGKLIDGKKTYPYGLTIYVGKSDEILSRKQQMERTPPDLLKRLRRI